VYTKAARLLVFLTLLLASTAAWAGPPFQTDDPEPIDYRNYEFYTFATSDGTGVETDTAGPVIEFNYGVLPNVHLHVIVPMAAILPSNNPRYAPSGTGPNEYGIGDTETGIKLRFIQESKYRPMVGTFTMFELPSGDSRRGCGAALVLRPVPGAQRFPLRLECPVHGWIQEDPRPIRMRFHKDYPNW